VCISAVERLHCKRPIPICRLFFKIDLLTDIVALCLTDFMYLRAILCTFQISVDFYYVPVGGRGGGRGGAGRGGGNRERVIECILYGYS
jgi:hypothetical protein